MRLVVNGAPAVFAEAVSVAAVVAWLDCGTKGVAVAVNGAVVPRSSWPTHELRPGDRVEVLTAAQGG